MVLMSPIGRPTKMDAGSSKHNRFAFESYVRWLA
jgi:hypothetical protein